jgi:hypothetical protein
MMAEQEAGRGTLNLSKYYEEGGNKPRHYGKIKLSPALLDKIIDNDYVLTLSGWDKTGSWGTFISLSVDEYALDKQADKPQQDGFEQAHGAVDDNATPPDQDNSDLPF